MKVYNTQIETAQAMSASFNSQALNLNQMFGYALQAVWTGTATGTLKLQGSVDPNSGNINPVNWTDVTNSSDAVTTSGNYLWNVSDVMYNWVRLVYANSFIESGAITARADVGGDLNNTYFLINGANGTNWYIWFNVNSAGVDPAIAGRTGIEVDLATAATATTVGAGIRTALASVTSVGTITGSTSHANFIQVTAGGNGSLTDGAVATGFTLAYTAATGALTATFNGKGM